MQPRNAVDLRVGANLRHHRRALELYLVSLAERAGLHPTILAQLEAGALRASAVHLLALCTALEITPEDVYAGAGELHLPLTTAPPA